MILDATCGGRMMYRGRDKAFSEEEIIFMDIRVGCYRTRFWHREGKIHIRPTVRGDLKHPPFRDNVFNLIIFDPPHMRLGKTSEYYAKFGSLSLREARTMFLKANRAFAEILKPGGLTLAKICDSEYRKGWNSRRSELLESYRTNFKLLYKVRITSEHQIGKMTTYLMLFVLRRKPFI